MKDFLVGSKCLPKTALQCILNALYYEVTWSIHLAVTLHADMSLNVNVKCNMYLYSHVIHPVQVAQSMVSINQH